LLPVIKRPALTEGNRYVTISWLIELRDYLDSAGRRPLRRWLDELDAVTRARVTKALVQLSLGNLSDVKSVGGGVLERRLDFGPGYRLYFGRDGDALIILLAGGSKARQQRDIAKAQACWSDYKRRKRGTG
jgi:putative addiction module killer protein